VAKKKKRWSRADKLALIAVVIGFVQVALAILALML